VFVKVRQFYLCTIFERKARSRLVVGHTFGLSGMSWGSLQKYRAPKNGLAYCKK
jgi:hypothetical protein